MPDKKTGETPAEELTLQVGGEAEGAGETPADDAFDAERARTLIRKLREELKEKTKLTKDIDALKLQQTQAEDARLAQEKKWQELAEKRARETDEAKQELAAERIKRLRIQVAAAKKLNPALAERLQGTTQEEFEADADALIALFPQPPEPEPEPEKKQGAPSIDAAGLPIKKADKSPVAKLTQAELEAAKRMGMTPEDYAKWK